MVRWPGFGRQIADTIRHQGGEIVHCYMDRTPASLARERDMQTRFPLGQMLADLSDPVTVVFSNASVLDASGMAARSPWIGALTNATWLHPQVPEMWGPGIRWLAGRMLVVPLSDEGLLRLGTPRAGGEGDLPRRWRPPHIFRQSVESRIAALRAVLGEDAFWWLSAGAVLDRVNALSTHIWWALRDKKMVSVPRDKIERVWELADLNIGADGTVRFSTELRESLIKIIKIERPTLLSDVISWGEKLINAGIQEMGPKSLATVQARAMLARLQLMDPNRSTQAHRNLKGLAQDGFGEWVETSTDEEEQLKKKRIRLDRTVRPSGGAMASVTAGLVGIVLAVGLLPYRELLFPPKPEFRFFPTEPLVITPDKALRFYDRYQLEDSVEVRVGERTVRLLNQAVVGKPIEWRLEWTSEVLNDVERPGLVEVYLGYNQSPQEQSWSIGLFEVEDILLEAPPETNEGGEVLLSWQLQDGNEESVPNQWQIFRDEQAIGQVQARNWKDRPSGSGPWDYHIAAVGLNGQPYKSNVVEVVVSQPGSVQPSPAGPDLQLLLAKAGRQRAGQRLTTPKGDNALETYQLILAIDPANAEVLTGIQAMRQQYLQWADAALASGDTGKARLFTERARGMAPKDEHVLTKLQEINEREKSPLGFVLQAPTGLDASGTIELSWALNDAASRALPEQWRILRDRQEVARVKERIWEDQPSGSGPWQYQITAVGQGGRRYKSNPVAVMLPQGKVVLETLTEGNGVGKVVLTWEASDTAGRQVPSQWQVLRDGKEVAQVGSLRWQDNPPGRGPWQYQVKAVGPDGRLYGSDVVEVVSQTIPSIPSGPMVQIPAGSFLRGCNDKVDSECDDDDEKPARQIFLDAYSIDTYEVTVAQYRLCVEAGQCSTEGLTEDTSCNWEKADRDNHPINCVNWEQARSYCQAVGKRLPTEAEWEKAARGEGGLVYPWGNEWDASKANTGESNIRTTTPVGSYPSGISPYDVYDMAGNVDEWVHDWYDSAYYRNSPDKNPPGPSQGQGRSVRGGSFAYFRRDARVAYRGTLSPGYIFDVIGFRCASS